MFENRHKNTGNTGIPIVLLRSKLRFSLASSLIKGCNLLTGAMLLAAVLLGASGGFSPLLAGSWIHDPQSNCYIWNLFPVPNEAVRWTGACLKYKANGRGELQWILNGKPNGRYIGDYKSGVRHGRGNFYFPNGNRHTGIYQNDLANGHGEFIYANGNQYEGEFRNGAFHGRGSFHFKNGDRYVGGFLNSTFHGQGTFTVKGGRSFTGKFVNGKFAPHRDR
jgi:hypothetical protein